MKPFRFSFALPLLLGAFLLVMAPDAYSAAIYPARFGESRHVFGENEKDMSFSFSHAKAREFMAFDETSGKPHPQEACFGSVCYDALFLNVGFFVKGQRLEEAGQCGGSVSLALYPCMENTTTSFPPIMIDYTLEAFPVRAPGRFRQWSTGIENAKLYTDPVRYSYATPNYGSRKVPMPLRLPEVKFQPLEQGWAVIFTFRWIDIFDRVPFREGTYPESWRIVANRTREDGTVATWGTDAAPVVLSWGRPGGDFFDSFCRELLCNFIIGQKYRERSGTLRTYWSCYKEEQWMGYLDAGRPTFETKNPASDALFFERCAGPLLERNSNIDKAIFESEKAGVPVAPVRSMSLADRLDIISKLDRIFYVSEFMDEARRDYLLHRFLGEPVPQITVDAKARPKKLKKLDANREMSNDDLSLDGGLDDDGLIELDDIGF